MPRAEAYGNEGAKENADSGELKQEETMSTIENRTVLIAWSYDRRKYRLVAWQTGEGFFPKSSLEECFYDSMCNESWRPCTEMGRALSELAALLYRRKMKREFSKGYELEILL